MFDEVRAIAADRLNVVFHGELRSADVPEVLAAHDIGVAPVRPGFGTHFTNKIVEYLASGLFVLHSFEPEPSELLDEMGVGTAVDALGEGLAEALAILQSKAEQTRSERGERVRIARASCGSDAVGDQALQVVRNAMESRILGGSSRRRQQP